MRQKRLASSTSTLRLLLSAALLSLSANSTEKRTLLNDKEELLNKKFPGLFASQQQSDGRYQGSPLFIQGRRRLMNDWDNSDRRYTLNLHNYARNETARGTVRDSRGDLYPSSKNMNLMFWDAALASLAQSHSDQCEYESNTQRNTEFYEFTDECSFEYPSESDGISLGENIGEIGTANSMTASDVIRQLVRERWFAEHSQGYYSEIGNCEECGDTDRFTQMIWARTRYVGCGYTVCDETWDGENLENTHYFLVCNYYIAGNTNGDFPYESGDQCNECDKDRKVCSEGLCSKCMDPAWDVNGQRCTDSSSECESDTQCDSEFDSSNNGNNSDSEEGNSADAGMIAGIVIGVLCFIAIIVGVTYYMVMVQGQSRGTSAMGSSAGFGQRRKSASLSGQALMMTEPIKTEPESDENEEDPTPQDESDDGDSAGGTESVGYSAPEVQDSGKDITADAGSNGAPVYVRPY